VSRRVGEPCHEELKRFHESREVIEKANVAVVALSLDGIEGLGGDVEAATKMTEDIAPYFEVGLASESSVARLRIFHDLLFEKRGDLVVPTSILIDSSGKLAGYYEGVLTTSEVIEHVEISRQNPKQWASLPFSGRWLVEPLQFRLSEYGNKLLDYGFLDDAARLLKERQNVEQKDGDMERLLSRLGAELEKKNDLDQALRFYQRLAKLRPSDPLTQSELADKLMKEGRYFDAEEFYRKSLQLSDESVDVRYNLGLALKKQRRFREAFQEFQKVLDTDPKHAFSHTQIAEDLVRQRRRKAARPHMIEALRGRPDLVDLRVFLAGELLEEGKLAAAEKHYRYLLDHFPEKDHVLLPCVRFLASSKSLQDRKRAQVLAKKAVKKRKIAKTLTALAEAQVGMNEVEAAVRNFKQAMEFAYDEGDGDLAFEISERMRELKK